MAGRAARVGYSAIVIGSTIAIGPPSAAAMAAPRAPVAGFLTHDMSFAMHTLTRRQGLSLRSLMADAFGDSLCKHGESPIGN